MNKLKVLYEEEEPPSISHSKGSCRSAGDSGTCFSDLHRIPVWRRGLIPGMGFNWGISDDSLYQHKVVDLGNGENG